MSIEETAKVSEVAPSDPPFKTITISTEAESESDEPGIPGRSNESTSFEGHIK